MNDAALIEWLMEAASRPNSFPTATLEIPDELLPEARKLVDEVEVEALKTSDDARIYFTTSRPRFEFITALALERPPGRILDLGCSPGYLAMVLTKGGHDVLGIYLNTEWLKKYAPGWAEILRIRQVQIEHEPIDEPDSSFDLILFTEVLEHIAIAHPSKLIAEIRRLLKPGGQLLLSTPNVANFSNILALATGQNVFWPPPIFYGSTDRHNREYTPLELWELLSDGGFANVELGFANTPSNWNHKTAGETVARFMPLVSRKPSWGAHPLFNNTLFARATA